MNNVKKNYRLLVKIRPLENASEERAFTGHEKKHRAVPHPANVLSQRSIGRQVIHIPTMSAAARSLEMQQCIYYIEVIIEAYKG